MRRLIAGALCAVGLLGLSLAVYLGFGFMDAAADTAPPAWEAGLMTPAVRTSVGRRAPALRNPLPDRDETLISGGRLYMQDCVGCHGGPGQPPSDFGATFYPRVPQFAQVGSQYSVAQLFWVAKHGIRMSGMYPQAPHYQDSQLWSLAAFIARIRSLPPGVVKALRPSASR